MTSPRDIADRQLDRYNARDLDGFCALFHEDAELWDLPTMQPRARGMAEIRKVYTERFQSTDLHCIVHSTMDLGPVAIDRETVTGIPQGTLEAVAIYHVEDGLIRRVFFVRS